MHIHQKLTHFAAQQKLIKHCKSTIFQFYKLFKENTCEISYNRGLNKS